MFFLSSGYPTTGERRREGEAEGGKGRGKVGRGGRRREGEAEGGKGRGKGREKEGRGSRLVTLGCKVFTLPVLLGGGGGELHGFLVRGAGARQKVSPPHQIFSTTP